METEMRMTVREFRKFCKVYDIVLKDQFNGKTYTKLDNYMDEVVTGFYPRFDLDHSRDTYNPYARIQIVAWIEHHFEEESRNEN